jgi:geranylgeranyl transferase type-2 subunit beta
MTQFKSRVLLSALILSLVMQSATNADDTPASSDDVLRGLRAFYEKTARSDGSFQPGIDPQYLGMSDSAYSDLAAITYACTVHKTFGWRLPFEQKTVEFLLDRQRTSGEFFNVAGTVDPASPQGRVYNTTQALVALRALGAKPRHNPLPVFEVILKADYKTLPAYSTSFFPLAYLCYGKPIPPQADRAIRALMIQDEDGYLNDHIAATFHASHYYALVGEPTPKAPQMIDRILRDQKKDGSWLLNQPARDRHATFDAVFTLLHEGRGREDCKAAIDRAAAWALSCRNADGGFGHFPGSTSDADAVYFQVGTLVMAGVLKPVDPLPPDAELLSWGHAMPVRARPSNSDHIMLSLPGWVGGVALSRDGTILATASSDHIARTWETRSGKLLSSFKGHTDAIAAVALSADGQTLATAGYDHTAKLWDVASSTVRQTLTSHNGVVTSVAFAPDGSLLATASLDGEIKLWDPMTAKLRHNLRGHKSWVNAIAFSPDGEQLVSGSSDGTVKLWSTADRELLKTLPATKAEVRSVAYSPDGAWIAAGMRYGIVKVWTTSNWEVQHTWELTADDVSAVAFTPDSTQMLIGTGEWNRPGRVEIWDLQAGKKVKQLSHTGEVLSVAVSGDGRVIAAGGADRSVSIWRQPAEANR